AVARRRAPLLAVAPLRPVPAAAWRAHARARPAAVRTHPARARGRSGARARALSGSHAMADDIAFTRHEGRRGVLWLVGSYRVFTPHWAPRQNTHVAHYLPRL